MNFTPPLRVLGLSRGESRKQGPSVRGLCESSIRWGEIFRLVPYHRPGRPRSGHSGPSPRPLNRGLLGLASNAPSFASNFPAIKGSPSPRPKGGGLLSRQSDADPANRWPRPPRKLECGRTPANPGRQWGRKKPHPLCRGALSGSSPFYLLARAAPPPPHPERRASAVDPTGEGGFSARGVVEKVHTQKVAAEFHSPLEGRTQLMREEFHSPLEGESNETAGEGEFGGGTCHRGKSPPTASPRKNRSLLPLGKPDPPRFGSGVI